MKDLKPYGEQFEKVIDTEVAVLSKIGIVSFYAREQYVK